MKETDKKRQNFFLRTLKLFRPFWGSFAVVFFLMLVGQMLAIASPYLYGRSVDAVLRHDPHALVFSLGGAFLLTLLQTEFLNWFRESIEVKKLDENIEHYLSDKALEKMFSFSVGQHVNEHSGVRQAVVSRGQNGLNDVIYSVLYTFIPNILQILVIFGILAYLAWPVALVAAFFFFLFVLITYKQNAIFLPKINAVFSKRRNQSKLQSEFFRNSTLVIAEAQEEKALGQFDVSAEEHLVLTRKTWLEFLGFFYATRPLLIIGQYASLGVGIYLIFQGRLSTGMFVTLFSWTGSVFGNLQQMMNLQRRTVNQIVEIRKFYELLDLDSDVSLNQDGPRPEIKGGIEFRQVSFAYPYRFASDEDEGDRTEAQRLAKEKRVVTDVSFSIPAGAKVGFVGSSGSGKSTIVNLMRRYYDPTEGSVLIDGVDLKTLDLGWLRGQIGNVEQKIELFDRSIRDNILFGLPKGRTVTEAELARVVNDASLGDFIAKLPEGLDTHIGENGIKISGGERQRIGIARAFIKDPKILIFDEATSALDSVNEKLIHDAINRGAEGRTTIIIAHRLSTVSDADIIFVVANGVIVASGKHEDLQKTSPDYQKLIKNQIF